ncbi:Transposable element Tcb1 transposase [Paramuricea clavata]|uniref:Transposable element Tcb1 transposase n=1 Tax=Paramuricea clavata TaxID=317549 RepID=A0A7D9I302_PARCT|nr:Transposable element Tcb1 transposase [Paramuricea clavata]
MNCDHLQRICNWMMMGKAKEHSIELRQRIVDFHKTGSSLGKISRRLKIPKQSVATIVRKYKSVGMIHTLPRSGRKPLLSATAEQLVRMVRSNPKSTKKHVCREMQDAGTQVSLSTVKRILHRHGLRGCRPRKKPLLQKRHLQARLKYACENMDKGDDFWNNVL